MNKLKFCEALVRLDGRPISFADRPYLKSVYAVDRGNLVIRASRQVEKSTLLANTIVHAACCRPDSHILLVLPRDEQASTFSHARLMPVIENSPDVRRILLGRRNKVQVKNCRFSNGSTLAVRAAYHSADSCRGISANLLLIDEFQDIAAGNLPVLQEVLSHAIHGRTIITGTPKTIENHLEAVLLC
jgi:phage terminase large subunit GpA-like protein